MERETGVRIVVLEIVLQHVLADVIKIGFSWACKAVFAEITLQGNIGSSL